MRVLLSTIGSRGDVQPVVALAVRLLELGHGARVCAPPDFGEWITGLGVPFVPIGPSLRGTVRASSSAPPTPQQRRQMAEGTVAAQFGAIPAAAEGCDVIVAATALQLAARSVAERAGLHYVYVSYCPTVLPSPCHPPPVLATLGERPADGTVANETLWATEARRLNDLWRTPLNKHREALGLAPVPDVRDHIFTGSPWLAADRALAPWPGSDDLDVRQTGAWLLPDETPLPAELAAFLEEGEPPVYFGFGSVRAPEGLGRTLIEAARGAGRRAVLYRGWAGLVPPDDGPDCICIGDVNQQALFPRVAAVVHHGGAGTTTAATRAGAPQVIIPRHYDQHYFAERVAELGVGAAHPASEPSAGSLAAALELALRPEVVARASALAGSVRTDGTSTAAEWLRRLELE